MPDIIEELRAPTSWCASEPDPEGRCAGYSQESDLPFRAADEIERLRKALGRSPDDDILRVRYTDCEAEPDEDQCACIMWRTDITGHCIKCGNPRRSMIDESFGVPTDITPIGTAAPDDEVVACLERALEEAKSGNLRSVAVVAEAGQAIYSDWTSDSKLTLVGMMEYVKGKIIAHEP